MECYVFFFQAEDGIRDIGVTGVQTCALPISVDREGTTARRRRSELLDHAAGDRRRKQRLTRGNDPHRAHELDRKSVVEGKRVDLGGSRIIKKKSRNTTAASTCSMYTTQNMKL